MLIRTHLAFAVFLIIFFISHINEADKFLFIGILLIASVIPDIDTGFSHVGNRWYLRPLQFFVKHRGIVHSITLGVILSFIIAIFLPVLSLGFFLGYGVHIFCDSFTKDGVQPFWPLKYKTTGPLRTGGRVEMSLFVTMVLMDILLIAFSLLR